MKKIPLTKGYVALVDDADYAAVSQFKWQSLVVHRSDGSVRNVYATRGVYLGSGKNTNQKMHRFILGISDPKTKVDHRNHVGLDNQ